MGDRAVGSWFGGEIVKRDAVPSIRARPPPPGGGDWAGLQRHPQGESLEGWSLLLCTNVESAPGARLSHMLASAFGTPHLLGSLPPNFGVAAPVSP